MSQYRKQNETEFIPTIRELCEQQRMIVDIWTVGHVQDVRPDLNDDQSWAVLQESDNRGDYDESVSSDMIRNTAEEMFPQ